MSRADVIWVRRNVGTLEQSNARAEQQGNVGAVALSENVRNRADGWPTHAP